MREAVKDKFVPQDAARPARGPLPALVPQRVRRDGLDDPRLRGRVRAHEPSPRRPGAARGLDRGSPRGDRHVGDEARPHARKGHVRDPSLLDLGRGGGSTSPFPPPRRSAVRGRPGRRHRSSQPTSTSCFSAAHGLRAIASPCWCCSIAASGAPSSLASASVSISSGASSQSSARGRRNGSSPCAGESSWRFAPISASRSSSSAAGPSPTSTSSTPRSAHLTAASTGPIQRSRALPTPCTGVVPDARAGRPRRPRRPLRPKHAPRPTHFATELRRVAGVEAASQVLGHSDLSTTLGIYGHQDQRDLERAMEAFANTREAEEAASRGNDSPSRLD